MLDDILDLFATPYEYRGYSSSGRIATAQTANSAKAESRDAKSDVEFLERRLGRLEMVTEALWEIIKRSHKLDDKALAELVKKIDMKDGKADGKVAKSAPKKCPDCGKTIQKRQDKCMYCGTDIDRGVFER